MKQKLAMVRESNEPGQTVAMVARRHGVNPNQMFHWSKPYQNSALSAEGADKQLIAASELADALKQIQGLERMLGKKTLKNEILKVSSADDYGEEPKSKLFIADFAPTIEVLEAIITD